MKAYIKKLNSLLEEEYAMINNFDSYINSMPDGEDKHELTTIMLNHEQNASQLRSQIESLGGKPKNVDTNGSTSTNFTGTDRTVIEKILKTVYDQEESSVELAQEITKSKVDEDTKYLVQEIVDINRTNLATIDRLLKRHNAN